MNNKNPLENVAINSIFYVNRKYLYSKGLLLGDNILVIYSKEDNCLFIKKCTNGGNKLCSNSKKTIKFRTDICFKKLNLEKDTKYSLQLTQDKFDKENNVIRCLIKKDGY